MRRLLAPAFVLILVAPACALKSVNIEDAALTMGELALQLDATERILFESGVIDVEKHKELSRYIIQFLYAMQGFERAVRAGQDGRVQREELVSTLADVAGAVKPWPQLVSFTLSLSRFLE